MIRRRPRHATVWLISVLVVAPGTVLAQDATAAPPPRPAPAPPSPVTGIRNKISAGDLLSAESILEVHRSRVGEDDAYLVGLSWLARGALLLGDLGKAKQYADDTRARCASRIAQGAGLETDQAAETALGAAIEVEAQLVSRDKGVESAASYLRGELEPLKNAPIALRSRLNKRLNLLTLTGMPAPAMAVEDFIGERPPMLEALRGQPVLLFLFASGCPDCQAQVAALARAQARHADKGLRVVALTRYYGGEADRTAERAQLERVWKAAYADLGAIPVVISAASMERYGGSSTPTFVFVDRAGVVRGYTPTRLTEAELDRAVATIAR
jgi:thiol-disulfide isomerase/thioredoxin